MFAAVVRKMLCFLCCAYVAVICCEVFLRDWTEVFYDRGGQIRIQVGPKEELMSTEH